VFADAWLEGQLAEISADIREVVDRALEALRDDALNKSSFTLIYFSRLEQFNCQYENILS